MRATLESFQNSRPAEQVKRWILLWRMIFTAVGSEGVLHRWVERRFNPVPLINFDVFTTLGTSFNYWSFKIQTAIMYKYTSKIWDQLNQKDISKVHHLPVFYQTTGDKGSCCLVYQTHQTIRIQVPNKWCYVPKYRRVPAYLLLSKQTSKRILDSRLHHPLHQAMSYRLFTF